MRKFEYDPSKSATNKEKHGIDFDAAQALWADQQLLTVKAKTTDEECYVAIGRIADKHWTGVFTYRGDAIRIISVRRSRQKEVELYES